jgi:mRNA-degrading endonuclease RelE of RelBE toxin-antitoxin system
VYRIRVARQAERQLKALDASVRRRIKKKVDEIGARIEAGVPANAAVEKRLRSPFHRFLQ